MKPGISPEIETPQKPPQKPRPAPAPRVFNRDAADDAFREYLRVQSAADQMFRGAETSDKYLEVQSEADHAYRAYRKALQKRHSAKLEAA